MHKHSPIETIIGIVTYIVAPLVAVIMGWWSWQEVLLLYWLENISMMIVRAISKDIEVLVMLPFTVVHGIFVAIFIAIGVLIGIPLDVSSLWTLVAFWAGSLIIQVIVAVFNRKAIGETTEGSSDEEKFGHSTKRIVALHLMLIIGFWFIVSGIAEVIAYVLILAEAAIKLDPILKKHHKPAPFTAIAVLFAVAAFAWGLYQIFFNGGVERLNEKVRWEQQTGLELMVATDDAGSSWSTVRRFLIPD
jgi:hypothetical protein